MNDPTQQNPTTDPTCPRCGARMEDGALHSAPGSGGATVCPACLLIGATEHPSGTNGLAAQGPPIEVLDAALEAYDVQVLLGQGGAGAVYRARHRKLDRLVAIKVLRPAPVLDAAGRAEFAERFEREARTLARLDHPHIVRIYDFGRAEDPTPGAPPFFFLALEYVEGASLRDLLTAGRLSPREVLEFVPQICDALQTAHDLGIVHRDIKPENILVDSAGRVRIADFGLAKLKDAEPSAFGLTRTNQVMGTVHYMAPEQMRASGAVDHRADLFSLGVVVYEMLTGELPIGRFAPPSASLKESKRFDDVVQRALENDPDARYQAAKDLRKDVEGRDGDGHGGNRAWGQGAEESGIGTTTATAARRRRRRARRSAPRMNPERAGASRTRSKRLESVSAGGRAALARSWIFLGILLLAYLQSWMRVNTSYGMVGDMAFHNSLHGGTVAGFAGHTRLGIFEAPWYLAFIAYAIATITRTLRFTGLGVNELIPWLLTTFGYLLTCFTLSFIAFSPKVNVGGGLVLAFGVFTLSSMFDGADFMQRRAARAQDRRLAREAA